MKSETIPELSETSKLGSATLREVALRAGVTGMTASRAISGKGYVSAKTREAVMKAAEDLSYRPNMAARSMKQQRSHLVGVLVQNNPELRFTHPLAWEFILGINEGLEQSGYMTCLIRFDDIAEDGGFSAKALEGHLLDGLIAVNSFPPEIEAQIEAATPQCVWLDANVWRETNCIRRDEEWAGELAVRRLAQLGYREITVVKPGADPARNPHYSMKERWQGVQNAARELGVAVDVWTEVHPEPGMRLPEDTYASLMPRLHRENALLVLSNYSVQALILAFAYAGIRLGHDVALACCDDDFQRSAYRRDSINRVAFNRFDLGFEAAKMMLQILQNPGARCVSKRIRDKWIKGRSALAVSGGDTGSIEN